MSRLVTLIRRRLRSPEDYRALQAYLAERSIAQLARRGVDLSGLRVLEVAAAYGGYSEALHARASLLVASDLHADPHFGRAGIPFVQLDASDTLPFCDGAFDLVYCSSLIEHLPAPQGLLAECRRVLRPRGQLYLTFPPFYSLFLVGGARIQALSPFWGAVCALGNQSIAGHCGHLVRGLLWGLRPLSPHHRLGTGNAVWGGLCRPRTLYPADRREYGAAPGLAG
ncbi:MAG: class I SAM-dependent methyltransferase [Anaerolineae bacterium]|jgi:SAM-dependent methyltransferase|nr:class I SAM-dependent methyltransferase [Chloroflexota bacterium]